MGSGGGSHYPFGTIKPNSQTRNATTHGALELTLWADSYDWRFKPVADGTFTDSSPKGCH